MYPVLSLMRRMASHVVYVRDDDVGTDGLYRTLRTETPTRYGDPSTGSWEGPTQGIRFYEVSVHAASAARAAQKMTEAENAVADDLGLSKREYTLLVLKERTGADADGERHTRALRFALAYGVYRANRDAPLVVDAKDGGGIQVTFMKTPPGTVEL